MSAIRIGVIGLGWFGEIHCETIVGVPSLELAALCTRRPDRLKQQAAKFGVRKTYADYRDMLADPEIDAVSIVTMWDQHTAPAIAVLEAGKQCSWKSRSPARSPTRRGSRPPAPRRRASCSSATSPLQPALPHGQAADRCRKDRQGRLAQLAPQYPRRVDAGNPQQDRPDRRRRHPRHRPDAVVHRRPRCECLRADGQRAQPQAPDIGQTMYRFASGATATLETVWCMPEKTPFDIDERMSIIGTEGFIHVQDTFPNLGIAASDKFHSPDTTYWPEFDGARGGALKGNSSISPTASASAKGRRLARRKTPPPRSRPPSPPRNRAHRSGRESRVKIDAEPDRLRPRHSQRAYPRRHRHARPARGPRC